MIIKLGKMLNVHRLGSAAIALITCCAGPTSADPLQGGVKEKAIKNDGGSSVYHSSNQNVDPFGGGQQIKDEPAVQSTPEPFASDDNADGAVRPRTGNHNRPGGSSNGGSVRPIDRNFGSRNYVAPSGSRRSENRPPSSRTGNHNDSLILSKANPSMDDSENAPQMQLLWDTWHQRVAQGVYARFNSSVRQHFRTKQRLSCQVSYVVTPEQQIQNIVIVKASSDPAFDNMLITVLKSMDHNGLLRYPVGSHRQSVTRSGTFTINETARPGFNFQKGDTEKIQQK